MKATRTCSVPDCGRKHFGRGWCEMHYRRWWGRQDGVKREPATGVAHHNWAGDQVGYFGAHFRVRRTKGAASDHTCACGSQAAHWAYDNNDPNESRHTDGRRYSPDPAHYLPLCVPCHSKHDADARSMP